MWKILSVKAHKSESDPSIVGWVELEYTPGKFDAPLRNTRGVKQGDGSYKNYDNVVISGPGFSALFKSCALKLNDEGKPYISIIGWETPREGFVDLAQEALRLVNGNGKVVPRGSRDDDLDNQLDDLDNANARTRGGSRR